MRPFPYERVLIADADPGLRQQVQRRLLDADLFADGVADGSAAIDHLIQRPYSVILLDLTLSAAGAERVLEFVRAMPSTDRPVVLVLAGAETARSLDVDLVQIVLRKPCDLNHLAELVQSCAETAMAHRELAKEPGELRPSA